MDETKVNLFIYGSLREPLIFKSVCGLSFTMKPSQIDEDTLFAQRALLPYYRKVSPDNVYFYAVSNRASRIEGLIIYDVPAIAMAEINKYEGKRYNRETVEVNTASGFVPAQAYLVSRESMKKHFGDRFHVNLIHELWLRKRIENLIAKRTRPGEKTTDAELERLAYRELLGTTERDLVITHYQADAVSDYYLEHELDRPRPSIKHLHSDKNAEAYIKNYLALVIKQVLFNRLEERIQTRFRFELEHMRNSERYFKRSVSILIALQMINRNSMAIDSILKQALGTMDHKQNDLIDYVKHAVHAADSIFDSRIAISHLQRIRTNFNPGLVPLGAEIELSNLGLAAVGPQMSFTENTDKIYDGFRYFHDFYLDVLSWKLGGYIDDHSGSTELATRSGFLELAPGRLSLTGELSRPATADPWLLNNLIREIVIFYNVQPHSLHLSLQLRKNQIGKQKTLPLSFVKCLLALGGGLEQKDNGDLWISRMGNDEIIRYDYGEELIFSRTSKRKWYQSHDDIVSKTPVHATAYTQQYKFIRLEDRANYEPLIMCLKGLQLSYNPGDYLSVEQLKASPRLQQQYQELKEWAAKPTQISPATISRFIRAIHDGLMHEAHNRPAHPLHYIDWALSAIDVQLRLFNKQIKKSNRTS